MRLCAGSVTLTERTHMFQGYAAIQRLYGFSQLRPMRGDNYCAVRATVYQLLVNRLNLEKHIGSKDKVLQVSAQPKCCCTL